MLRKLLLVATALCAFAALVVPASAGAYVYWANGGCCLATPSIGTIGRANNDGTGVNEDFIDPPGNSTNLQGLSISPNDIFWADAADGTVGHANIDGSNPNNFFIFDSFSTAGVASDSTYVFWSNYSAQRIYRANLDGSGPEAFVYPGGSVTGMTDVAGTLYWADNSNGTIGESPTGTGSASTLLTVPTPAGGSNPNVQFVAVGGGYVYWTDSANNTIGRASLADPSGTADDAFITGASGPEGVGVDSSYIYWSNSGQNGTTANNNSIGRATLDGNNVNQSFITGASVPYGLAVNDLGTDTTSVSCSPSSVPAFSPTTCTATVTDTSDTPSVPTGTVSFSSSPSAHNSFTGSPCTLAQVGTSTSQASCSVTFNAGVATTTVTGSYNGDTTHASNSGQATVKVTPRSSKTTVSCSPSSVAIGASTTCTATVADTTTAGTPSAPTGTVTFTGNKTDVFTPASCTLSAVDASSSSCSVSYSPQAGPNSHALTAHYHGDSTHTATAGSTTVTVTRPAT